MYTASCLCGACKIEISSIIGTGFCHCITCRKMTSSLFSMNASVPASAFQLKSGKPKTSKLIGDSGTESTMNFCGDCGSPLWMDYGPRPDLKILKAGILDGNEVMETEGLRPQVEQFTSRRPSWMCPVAGGEQESGQQGFKKEEDMTEETKSGKPKL